mgnify:CR=1 FL=1
MRTDGNEQIVRNLKIARGQVDGIIKMVEEGRYCIDIARQISATVSILKKVNADIIHRHMKSCVKDAIMKGEGDERLEEVFELLKKYI